MKKKLLFFISIYPNNIAKTISLYTYLLCTPNGTLQGRIYTHLSSSNTCSVYLSRRWLCYEKMTCTYTHTYTHTRTRTLIRSCRLQYSTIWSCPFSEIDMQIKWMCSSVLLRDFLKSNPRGNFEPFKYEYDNRVGAPNQGAEVLGPQRAT